MYGMRIWGVGVEGGLGVVDLVMGADVDNFTVC